jgi:hypothetical protein
MSDFTAIRAVSVTLQALLQDHITNSPDPQLNGVPIELRSPKEMRDDGNATGVSLWLYRVIRDAERLNSPSVRVSSNQLAHHALPVNLYYLVTPIRDNPADEQALLGRVVQVFNDHAALMGSDLKDTLAGGSEELRLLMEAPTLEELTRVWDALKEPYQLSLTYMVQLVTIESGHELVRSGPVLVRETEYKQILSVT